MPKMKTHRGAAKRFKVTGSGKIMRRRAFRKHLFEKKPTTRTRRLKPMVIVAKGNESEVKRMLGM
jgi:large subunit ribosomal protein L35